MKLRHIDKQAREAQRQMCVGFTVAALTGIVGLLSKGVGFGQDGDSQHLASRANLVALVDQVAADRDAGEVVRDSRGEIISMRLRHGFATESNLALLAGVNTLQRITLQAMPSDWTIGPAGFRSLAGLTNLTFLGLACGGELKRGTFAEICRLGQLRKVALEAVYPPVDEYRAVTNLRNLAEMYVGHATNFGDLQLCLLTNLPNLRNVRFDQTAVSDKWEGLLPSFKSLTNIVVKRGTRSTNWTSMARP